MKSSTKMKSSDVVIVDYKLGNLYSIENACIYAGLQPNVTSLKQEIIKARAIILPGVGSFVTAMDNLKKLDLIAPLVDHVNKGKIIFGICLGMQLMFSESEEFGKTKGLDIISGAVSKFSSESKSFKVPHIGWNPIYSRDKKKWENSFLAGIEQNEFMYFVHSYYVIPDKKEDILTLSNYDSVEYCSSIIKNNIFATQFHPEKSGIKGIKILERFKEFVNEV